MAIVLASGAERDSEFAVAALVEQWLRAMLPQVNFISPPDASASNAERDEWLRGIGPETVAIFCLTPASVREGHLLFDAGLISLQAGKLVCLLVGVDKVDVPAVLSKFPAFLLGSSLDEASDPYRLLRELGTREREFRVCAGEAWTTLQEQLPRALELSRKAVDSTQLLVEILECVRRLETKSSSTGFEGLFGEGGSPDVEKMLPMMAMMGALQGGGMPGLGAMPGVGAAANPMSALMMLAMMKNIKKG